MHTEPDAYLGTLFSSRWLIERQLTSGGMGSIYVAKHTDTGRSVALKLINSEAASDAEFVSRFRKETAALAAFSHPNIVTYLDSGIDNGNFYLVMELLEGRSLRDEMNGPMPWPRAFRIMSDVCRALVATHQAGIVHRDLKPENIFLQDSAGHTDFAKLIDFGIVRVDDGAQIAAPARTRTGAIVGTPGYISPEQLRGEAATPQSDLYAVGVILYELVTGTFPFAATNVRTMVVKQLIDPIAPPESLVSLPAEVAALIKNLMAREQGQRPARAADVLDHLTRTISEAPRPARRMENRAVASGPIELPASFGAVTPQLSPAAGKYSRVAICSLVVSILSLLSVLDPAFIVLSMSAMILGTISLVRIRRRPGLRGFGISLAAILIPWLLPIALGAAENAVFGVTHSADETSSRRFLSAVQQFLD